MGFPPERIVSRKYSTLMSEAMQAAPELGLLPDLVRQRIGTIYDHYDEDALTRWSLRPFVVDSLAAIKEKGLQTALVSNLGGTTLTAALSKFRLTDYFDITLSRNDVKNLKPSPEGLNCALAKLEVHKDACIFVGDSLDDVNAAKNAGIRVMIITAGENAPEEIVAAQPDHIIQCYSELLLLL
jgi:phosphoglycolate phosphatase